jgi:two-component system sensor histidine kinase EvgS
MMRDYRLLRWGKAYASRRLYAAGAVAQLWLLLSLILGGGWARASEQVRLVPMVNLSQLGEVLGAEDQQFLSARRVLRLGVDSASYEPLELLQGRALKGITPDYLAIVGASLGLALEVRVYRDWPAALAALRAGEVDVLGHGSAYEEQLPGLLLSRPYVENRPVLVARKKVLEDSLTTPLQGAVALVNSYASLSNLQKVFPQVKPNFYPSARDGLHALDKGGIDKFIGDEVTTAYQLVQGELSHLQMRPLRGLDVAGYSFVFRVDDLRLRNLFDRVLSSIPDITKASILNYWGVRAPFGETPAAKYSDAEKAWLADRPEVRVASSETIPPLSFSGEKDEWQGLIPDLLAEIGYYSGLRFKLVPVSTLAELEAGLREGEIDMTMMLQPSAEREQQLLFTPPFMQSSFALVGPFGMKVEGLADLHGKRVALSSSSIGIDWLHKYYPDIQVVQVELPLDSLVAVVEGRADCALLLFPIADYLIDQYFADDLSVLTTLPELDARVSFSVRASEPLLYGVFEKTLDHIGPSRIGSLVERWRSMQPAEKGAWSNYVRFGRWLSLAGGVVLIVSLIWLIYAYVRRQRLQAEDSRQAFRSSLLDGIPQSIAVRDLQGRFVLCNQAFYKAFGLTAEQVIGCRTSELAGVEEQQAEMGERRYFALLSKGEADLQQIEMTVKGQRMVLRQWTVPYKGSDGSIAGLIMGWIDMTSTVLLLQQLQAARDQAVEASEAKSRFLAVMSHEIRTPLNAIIGLLELTMRRVDQGEGWDRVAVEVAYSSSNALLLLIGDILDLAKIESGKLTLEPQRCAPQEVLDAVVRVFHGVARQKGLDLQVEIKLQGRHAVMMDGGRLKQVLSNLLSNAIKFTDRGGVRVTLDGRVDGDRLNVFFEVKDSGIGISADDQALLFEPFSQARDQSNQRGGTGLGLVICRQLIEMMGGSLALESTPGLGTKVHVEFVVPILPELPTPALPGPAVVAAAPAVALRVLLVDDHPANRLLLGQQLHFLGHTLCEAEDGAQAFALAMGESKPFDAVITDVNMPVMNGYELARKIRIFERETSRKACRVIGFTANAQLEERQRCLDAGMDECLFKPVGLDALKACLGMLAPRQAAPDQVDSEVTNALPAGQFDLEVIDSLTGGDQQLVRLLFNELHKSNNLDLRQLDEGLSAGRWRDQGQLVHRFKGAARMVGAQPVVLAALAYEDGVAESVEDEEMQRLATGLRRALALLQAALDDWLAENAT